MGLLRCQQCVQEVLLYSHTRLYRARVGGCLLTAAWAETLCRGRARRCVNTRRTRTLLLRTRFTLSSGSSYAMFRPPISRTIWQAALSLTAMATSKANVKPPVTRINSWSALPRYLRWLTSRRCGWQMGLVAWTQGRGRGSIGSAMATFLLMSPTSWMPRQRTLRILKRESYLDILSFMIVS